MTWNTKRLYVLESHNLTAVVDVEAFAHYALILSSTVSDADILVTFLPET